MPYVKFLRSNGLFAGGAMHDVPPHDPATEIVLTLDEATYHTVAVRTSRWDGADGIRPATATERAEAAGPQGLAFVRVVHLQLDGVDDAAKLAKAITLRVQHSVVETFSGNLSYAEGLSSIRHAIVKRAWAEIKALNLLTAGEISRIEALALTYGFPLI